MDIQICKEVTDFLEFQIYGERTKKSLSRFTKVHLSKRSKKLLKVVMNAIYFGDQLGALKTIDSSEANDLLLNFQSQVSSSEIKLVQFLSVVLQVDKHSKKQFCPEASVGKQ